MEFLPWTSENLTQLSEVHCCGAKLYLSAFLGVVSFCSQMYCVTKLQIIFLHMQYETSKWYSPWYFFILILLSVSEMCNCLSWKISTSCTPNVFNPCWHCGLCAIFIEHCGTGRWVCWWPQVRWQHKGSSHTYRTDGDDRILQTIPYRFSLLAVLLFLSV